MHSLSRSIDSIKRKIPKKYKNEIKAVVTTNQCQVTEYCHGFSTIPQFNAEQPLVMDIIYNCHAHTTRGNSLLSKAFSHGSSQKINYCYLYQLRCNQQLQQTTTVDNFSNCQNARILVSYAGMTVTTWERQRVSPKRFKVSRVTLRFWSVNDQIIRLRPIREVAFEFSYIQ